MQIYFDPAQLGHKPQQFMVAGRIVAPFEVPERADRLAARLREAGHDVQPPAAFDPMPAIAQVHPAHYTDFLSGAHRAFQAIANAGPEVLPNVHPHVSGSRDGAERGPCPAASVVGRAGWYLGDMACAIGPASWSAAKASAQSAIAAADAVAAGSRHAMALCRPPGHHAYRDRASGFCFLNNAAIAVGVLQKRFRRIAIVDFDTHHGDGTQAIFYGNASVLVASTHTDPSAYYPFYIGYEHERGIGAGLGTNLNVPLAEGSGDNAFLAANHQLLAAVDTFAPDAIIVSAGWDAHRDDPLSKLDVTTEAYAALGDLLGQRAEPIVILQEGGYSLTAIEQAAVTFLDRFEAARSG